METAIFTAFEEHKHFDQAEAERNLMRALLKTLMDDVQKGGEHKRRALAYIYSREEDYVFSFVSVCKHLDICPKTIQTLLGL